MRVDPLSMILVALLAAGVALLLTGATLKEDQASKRRTYNIVGWSLVVAVVGVHVLAMAPSLTDLYAGEAPPTVVVMATPTGTPVSRASAFSGRSEMTPMPPGVYRVVTQIQ